MSDDVKREIEYSGADAMCDAIIAADVDCVFLNSGTDYPPIIESWAKYEAQGLKVPRVITSPHEYVALSAAQGYAQLTGKMQAVFVHVDVGTQNLGGAIHNAFRCRTPVFVLAGLSPYTIEGELPGGRNSYIQFVQNVADQTGIVRGYTKYAEEYHSGKNIQQMTYRAIQIAKSEPMGPVYMTATREVLSEEGIDIAADMTRWGALSPSGLDSESVEVIVDALSKAKKPLIITSYSGRNKDCPAELVKLAEKLSIPVIEANQSYMNFPGDNQFHAGFDVGGFIEFADVVLVIDCDVPWIPVHTTPKYDCRVFHIDIDPLKESIPLWYIKAERAIRADSLVALRQLNEYIDSNAQAFDAELIESRRSKVKEIYERIREDWKPAKAEGDMLTPEIITTCVSEMIDKETILLNEAITSKAVIDRLVERTVPGTSFGNAGSSLGWHGGAALGMKLACPDKDVVALTGDGSYIFSCPTPLYWMAARYNAPFMTVIYNNQGWNAPKTITRAEYPDGYAVQTSNYHASLAPSARFDLIAEAAGGAFARTVTTPDELRKALAEGKQAVKDGKCAVINAMLSETV